MPILSHEEIGAAIGDGSITGVAIDTSIFDRYRCDLDHPKLRLLDQFHDSKLTLLVPEIVAREVQAHIATKALETKDAMRKALRDYAARWKVEANDDWVSANDPEEEAARQLQSFTLRTAARIVPLIRQSRIAMSVFDRYFSGEPPFETREHKKHEIPDAFALLALEDVATRQERLILCVSADVGWQNFCAASDELVCIDNLDTALSLLHRSGRTRAEEVWRDFRSSGLHSIHFASVHAAFRRRQRALDFTPDAIAPLPYIAEPVLEDLDSIDMSSATPPKVVDADEETITFTFHVTAEINFVADFRFYPNDEMRSVELSTVRKEIQKAVEYEVIITIDRDESVPFSVRNAEVDRLGIRVRFGEVEPFDL